MIININKPVPETSMISDEFDVSRISSYTLFLYAGDDAVAVAVLDPSSAEFIALQSYSFGQLKGSADLCNRLANLFSEDMLLEKKSYNQVNFCYAGTRATLVPDPLYHDSGAAALLAFNYKLDPEDQVHTDHLKILGARNIFAVPGDVERMVSSQYPQATFHHFATPLIESVLLNNKNRDEKIITVHVHLSGFEITVTRRNELIFFNSFTYKSTEDFLYYVLFTMEQLQLNPESIPLVFAGSAERSSAIYLATQKYIRNISFAERTNHFSFAGNFEEIPAHFYYILFNQHLCAS